MAPVQFGLSRAQRVRQPSAFAATIRSGLKVRDRFVTVYAAPNYCPHARLGLAVSRRVSTKAVVRNRIKRLMRESFRLYQAMLPGLDIVVVAHAAAAAADAATLRQSLAAHWTTVAVRCVRC